MNPKIHVNPAQNSYLICTSPRTGSELLCEYLSRTQIAGKPGEHFFPKRFPNFFAHYQINTFAEYYQIILQERTTPNHVFGTKMIAGEILTDFLITLRQQSQAIPNSTDHQLLTQFFPNLTYIRLTRQDRLRQAISFYRAESTGIWHNTGIQAKQPELPYNFTAIKTRFDKITQIEQHWDQFFTQNNLAPHTLSYESFIASPIQETHQILTHLKLALPDTWQPNLITNKKMKNNQTEEWIQRFHQDIKIL